MTPCPQCLGLAEKDSDIQVMFTEMDRAFIEGEQLFDETASLKDLLSADDADWLIKRVA